MGARPELGPNYPPSYHHHPRCLIKAKVGPAELAHLLAAGTFELVGEVLLDELAGAAAAGPVAGGQRRAARRRLQRVDGQTEVAPRVVLHPALGVAQQQQAGPVLRNRVVGVTERLR